MSKAVKSAGSRTPSPTSARRSGPHYQGAVLISALTASFLTGVENNPAVPKNVASKAQVQLAGGAPFVSDQDLKTQLGKAGVPSKTADAIVQENATARIDGLRAALSVLAVVALIAVPFSRRIPAHQPSAQPASETDLPDPGSTRRREHGPLG